MRLEPFVRLGRGRKSPVVAWNGIAAGLVTLSLACTEGAPAGSPSSIRKMEASEITSLTLVRLDSLVLRTHDGMVQGISDFVRYAEGFAVVDRFSKHVHLFDTAGKYRLSFGGNGDGPGEFRDPMGVAIDGAEILVVDPGRGRAINTFDSQGAFVAVEQLPIHHAPIALHADGGKVYVLANGAHDPVQLAQEGDETLWVLGEELEVLGRGCSQDPRYVESLKRRGRIDRIEGGSISVQGGRIFCAQVISPVIEVMDTTGIPLGTVRVAPPFYKTPIDSPFVANDKVFFGFLSQWTSHRKVFGLRDGAGFVSVYGQFDETRSGFRYWLFRCGLDADLRVSDCASIALAKKPLLVTPDGDVYLEEDTGPSEPPVVGHYAMTVER